MAKKNNKPEFEIEENNVCPECGFAGDEKFPNGFTIEGNGSSKHCPSCGYWRDLEKNNDVKIAAPTRNVIKLNKFKKLY